MLVFISVLVLQLLIVGLGVWLGYKRGIGRGIVRLVELLVIGTVSLIVGRVIAAKIASKAFSAILPLLGEEISTLIQSSESISALLVGFVGALIVPLVFALLFSVLGLLTLILLKKRSNAIVKGIIKKEEDVSAKKNRLIGMGIGAVSAVLIALVLFSPIHTALSLVGGLSDESIALVGSILSTTEDGEEALAEPDSALAVRVTLLKKQGFDLEAFLRDLRSVNAVATPLSLNLATAKTPDGARYNAVEEAVALTNAVGAAATAITVDAEKDPESGEPVAPASPIETLNKAATVALPHIAGQPFAKELVVSTANAAGTHIQNGGSIGGVSAHSGDMMNDIMVDAISEVFVNTTKENLSDTTVTLFGIDLNQIEQEQKTEKELAKESKEAAKESKKAEKEAAKESKKAEKDKNKNTTPAAPETTKTPETPVAPETTKTPEDTSKKPEDTAKTPEDTSKKPEDTSKKPEDTSKKPAETTKAPETTKPNDPVKDPVSDLQKQQGALTVLAKVDFNNATAIFEDEEQSGSLIEAVYIISANPTFAPVVSAFGELGGQLMKENSATILPNMSEEAIRDLYESLLESVEAEGKYNPERSLQEKVPSVKSSLVGVAESYKYPITDNQAELGSICIVARFFTKENMANPNLITYEDFRDYLAIND